MPLLSKLLEKDNPDMVPDEFSLNPHRMLWYSLHLFLSQCHRRQRNAWQMQERFFWNQLEVQTEIVSDNESMRRKQFTKG